MPYNFFILCTTVANAAEGLSEGQRFGSREDKRTRETNL
jgi:hypothetical protein